MLFGVRVVVDSMRKSEYEQPLAVQAPSRRRWKRLRQRRSSDRLRQEPWLQARFDQRLL